jgi:ABC-type Zn uptake system ZnuABC Zn-binding protein ZnuA
MQAVRKADLFVEVGMSLEMWAVNVLDGAGNKRVRRGSKGHVYASEGIPVLEVPTSMTRAKGDLHPNGNPHIWIDPVRLGGMAKNILIGLKRIRPSEGDFFQKRYDAFQKKLDLAIYGPELVKLLGGKVLNRLAISGKLRSFLKRKYKGRALATRLGGFLKKAEPLRGRKILFYHQTWVYFVSRFGLDVRGFVEDKPGITPSASHKLKLMEQIKAQKIKVLGTATWNDDSVPNALSRETGIRVVVLPAMVGATKDAGDSISLVDSLIQRLLNGYQKG